MRRSSSSRSAATPTRRREKIDAVVDRVDEVQQAHPQLFIGEFGNASAVSALGHRVRRGPREGRADLAADHVDHPRGRVRGAGRGGHPAAPRPDRGVRDVRAGRRRQPGDAARRGVGRARPADRARRRRRLLDVLLEARTRGTRRRTERTGCDRGRRGHVGALRARLRPDGDGRHGGPVPDPRRDVRLVRPRDDDRRRDRDARLADRAPGASLEARRPRRPAPRAVRRPAQARQQRRSDLGRGRRPRAPQAGAVRRPRRRAARRARDPGAPAQAGDAGTGHVPAVAAGRRDVQPDAVGVPRDGAPRQRRRVRRRTSTPRPSARRSRSSSSRRSRPAACTSRSRST